MKKENRIRWLDAAIAVSGVFLCVGSKLLFHACGAHDDGSYMSCHWAEQGVFAFSLVMLAEALVLLCYRGRGQHGVRAGLSLAIALTSVCCAVLPGVFIPLCMSKTMRCHTLMRPSVLVLCILLTLLSAAAFLLHKRQCGRHAAGSAGETSV